MFEKLIKTNILEFLLPAAACPLFTVNYEEQFLSAEIRHKFGLANTK